jgi:ABC-type polar amino acid transport system ATPase subunit
MTTAVELINVSKIFRAQGHTTHALREINLEIPTGEVTCLIGPSGSGKSTCLRAINGLETITQGSIRIFGEPYTTFSKAHCLRQKTAMIFQRFELFPHLTALENIALVPHLRCGLNRVDATSKARALLARVGLSAHENKYPKMLSGGQQQRVAIARALAVEPKILLCDEPTSALDPELVSDILKLLKEIADSGMTMIIVTHEMNFARQVSRQCHFFDGGALIESGATAQLLNTPASPRLKEFLSGIEKEPINPKN